MHATFTFTEIRYILTDIDDTLTVAGKLPASAYTALWRQPVTGLYRSPDVRPAGVI